MELNLATSLEIIAVALNLIYLFLLMQEKIACWFFGIAGSAVSIYLFIDGKLYSESILYLYYVIIGIYGYRTWDKARNKGSELPITEWGFSRMVLVILISIAAALGLGSFFYYNSDANNPFLDAFTTIFSFAASYLEVHKVLSGWIFWIVINGATIGLYYYRGFFIYMGLTVIYFLASILGYYTWRKRYRLQTVA